MKLWFTITLDEMKRGISPTDAYRRGDGWEHLGHYGDCYTIYDNCYQATVVPVSFGSSYIVWAIVTWRRLRGAARRAAWSQLWRAVGKHGLPADGSEMSFRQALGAIVRHGSLLRYIRSYRWKPGGWE
jgi:hypothetical protein